MIKSVTHMVIGVCAAFALCTGLSVAHADTSVTNVYLFYGKECPHCAKEEAYLDTLASRSDIHIERYEVWHNTANQAFAQAVADRLGVKLEGVPFTVVGDKSFIGWADDHSSDKRLIDLVDEAHAMASPDVVTEVKGSLADTTGIVVDTPNASTTPETSASDFSGMVIAAIVFVGAGLGLAAIIRSRRVSAGK